MTTDNGLVELRDAHGQLQARLDLRTLKLIIRDRKKTTEHDLSRYLSELTKEQASLQVQNIVLK